MIPEIDYQASDAVRAALSNIGRTEDLRFSPDNRLLAIAGFARKRCLILQVDIERTANGPRVTVHDRHILVADAGSPRLHVYDSDSGWNGRRAPSRAVVVLDDETFLRGRSSDEEGGPKGLDIDRSNSVMAITREEQTLAFYRLASVVGQTAEPLEPDLAQGLLPG